MKSCLLLSLILTAAIAQAETPPLENGRPFVLTIAEGRVSARATDGSVVQMAEDLGRLFGFEVIAQGVGDVRVTVDFEDLSPSEAIRKICRGVGYVEVPDFETGRTVRVVLTPGSNGSKNRLSARRDPLPSRAQRPVDPPDTRPVDRPERKPKQPDKKDD